MKGRLHGVFASAAAFLAVTALAAPAWSEESAYCKKVQGRAAGDAALLFAPSVQAQAIKFPNAGTIDAGVTTGSGYQFRGGISWSPLDFYKGFRVLEVGRADCERHEAVVSAQEVLLQGIDYGRLPALRKQASFLDSRRATWEAIVAKSEERLEARITSFVEANDIRSRAAELERKRLQVGGEVQRLEAKNLDGYRGMLSQLMASVETTSMRFEREASHVRSLDAWDLRVTGGVIPQERPVDYYGIVQLSFNFGAFSRNAGETRYLDARAEELKKARYETREQLRIFREQVASAKEQATRELGIVEKQASTLGSARQTLASSEAPNAPQALGVIDLHIVLVESDRVFLAALIEELSRLEDNRNGH
jgi:hypothetical protein